MRNRTKYIGRTALVAGGLAVLGGLGSTAAAATQAPAQPDPIGGLLGDLTAQGMPSGQGQQAQPQGTQGQGTQDPEAQEQESQDQDLSGLDKIMAAIENAKSLAPGSVPINQPSEQAVVRNEDRTPGRLQADPKPPIEFLDGAIEQALTGELAKELAEVDGQQQEGAQAPEEGQEQQQPAGQSAQGGQQTQQDTSAAQQPPAQQEQPGRPPAAAPLQPEPQPAQQGQPAETGQGGLTETLGQMVPGGLPTDGLPLNLGKNTVTPFF
jgi:hypothetical protein